MLKITEEDYKCILNLFEEYFEANELEYGYIEIELKRGIFLLSVLATYNPTYIGYIGLKTLYRDIENDFDARKIKNRYNGRNY